MRYIPPLHLHLVVPAGDEAEVWIESLVAWFTGSRTAGPAGAGIPLFAWRGARSDKPPALDIDWSSAARTALVVLVHDETLADAWQSWLERQARAKPATAAWINVACTANFKNLRPDLTRHQTIRLFATPGAEQGDELRVLLTHALSRWFAPASDGRVRLFLSHAKAGTPPGSGRDLALRVKGYLEQRPAGQVFFDEVSIAGGDEWTAELDQALTDSAVIALVTDPFSSRYWCGFEITQAKIKHRPMVVVDALRVGEASSLAFLGKCPTIRWDPTLDANADTALIRRIVAATLLEVLRIAHEHQRLDTVRMDLTLPTVQVLSRPPELATLPPPGPPAVVLYPDPPLPRYELDLIATHRPDLRLVSGTQALAGLPDQPLPLQGCRIALSISDPPKEDLASSGFDREALQPRLWAALAVHLLASGAEIAYGGDLRVGGFVAELADLAQSAADANRPFPVHTIHWFVGWPTVASLTAAERAKLPPAFRLHEGSLPAALAGSEFAHTLPRPAFDPNLTPRERLAWTLGMREMRARMADKCHARIVVGGQLRAVSPWPGLLEEVETFAGKPVYLIGAFGGMTRVLIEALQGGRPQALTPAFQHHDAARQAARDEYERSVGPVDLDRRVDALAARGVRSLDNGLNPDENARLFAARDPTEIVALVLAGLRRRFPQGMLRHA